MVDRSTSKEVEGKREQAMKILNTSRAITQKLAQQNCSIYKCWTTHFLVSWGHFLVFQCTVGTSQAGEETCWDQGRSQLWGAQNQGDPQMIHVLHLSETAQWHEGNRGIVDLRTLLFNLCDTLLSPVFWHKLSGCGEEVVAEQVVQLGWEEHWILHTQLGPVQLNNIAREWLFQA